MEKWEIISAIAGCLHLLGVMTAIAAVMRTRTSQGTIAWVISLLSFPYLAVPAYWVFGRNKFRGYVTARQEYLEEFANLAQHTRENLALVATVSDHNAATRAAEKLAQLPIVKGNRVDLLIDGEATFESIFAGLRQAHNYVLVQFYIVRDDALGRRLKDALIATARRGVPVYFLFDEIGSRLPQAYLDDLRSARVEVRPFHTSKGWGNRFQLNFRNHRKIVVVDGRMVWIGGHNVGIEYLGQDPQFGPWRDTHVKIEGPAVLGAQLSFVEDWHWSAGVVPPLSWHPHRSPNHDTEVLIVPSGPADQLETAGLMYLHAINTARERIWIASPYFVPDEAVTAGLLLAGLRGVDVRILIPDNPDHLLVYLCAYSYLDEAGRTGVKFYRYQGGFMHQKVTLIDDRVAAIGTVNCDNRSFRLNFEITALIRDERFALEVKQMLDQDFSKARLMERDEYKRKPFLFRLGVRMATLTAPLQ